MVLEVTVERMKSDHDEGYELFTVHIGEQRILTLYASSGADMAKWVLDVQKAYRNKKGPLVIGVGVDREPKSWWDRGRDRPFNILTLCIGSHCLIYYLPDGSRSTRGYGPSNEVPVVLKNFLTDSNTICVGMDIGSFGKKLEKDQRLKVGRQAGVRDLALETLDELRGYHVTSPYLQNLSLDEITQKLLGKQMDVVRTPISDPWEDQESIDNFEINRYYAKYLTVDAFFCHELGVKFLDKAIKISSKTK